MGRELWGRQGTLGTVLKVPNKSAPFGGGVEGVYETMADRDRNHSNVFFVPLADNPSAAEQAAAVVKLIEAADALRIIEQGDFTAIKFHVGEEHNTTHICPEVIRAIVQQCHAKTPNVFLTETSTLYKGERENAVKHLTLANKHGFSFENIGAPFIMADGLIGSAEIEMPIPGELDQSVRIAREIAFTDALIAVSHPTGHVAAGLGACLKNLGMGLASRAGKMRQHSSLSPRVKSKECRLCGKCIRWCPKNAIIEGEKAARIDPDKCIGCGECMTLCRHDAIDWNWGVDAITMQKSMVEHAYGVIKDKPGKGFFINVLVGMTANCDCIARNQSKLMPDLGILGSFDPLAVDMATMDLTAAADAEGRPLPAIAGRKVGAQAQLEHAARLGLGSMEYELIRLA